MTSLTAFAEAGFEPIPGYVLREKIGTGGFGEVWLADAPGGLKKALKLVFGHIDDTRAANELKSLQRIRQINHPFILSLERIEVINGQLIVVTELADCSLLDRFTEMRRKGLAGIPRDRLLKYLGDAADALDFICQRYELQHLDVKPGNLLLVADHIKLADFGLIKDLQLSNQSMLTGLTPVYAAPEMFDGRPCRFSDQYALAIVYQEMLTGTFPFQGRTTAQLATEHLTRAPNLEPLPLEDRAIIARALSKKPSQRFASCREMIDCLIRSDLSSVQSRSPSTASAHSPTNSTPRPAGNKEKSPVAPSRSNWVQDAQTRTATRTAPPNSQSSTDQFDGTQQAVKVKTLKPINFTKAPSTEGASIFIGIGRTGLEALLAARHRLSTYDILDNSKPTVWLGIDSDKSALEWACDSTTPGALACGEVLHLPLHAPHYYKDKPKELYSPISRRWLYNIPRSLKTEGVRALGLLAFLDQTYSCYDLLGSNIAQAIAKLESEGLGKQVDIYLLASSHGGTGSALICELGFLTRRIMAELREEIEGLPLETITAIITTGSNEENSSHDLACASSIACLRELNHYIQTGLHPGFPALPPFPLAAGPVDNVYTVQGGRLGRTSDWQHAILNTAEFLCQDAFTPFGTVMRNCRRELTSPDSQNNLEYQSWLRTFVSSNIQLSGNIAPSSLAKHWLLEILVNWSTAFENSVAMDQAIAACPPEQSPQSQPAGVRKTIQAIELFCDDLFRENAWNAQAWVRTCLEYLLPKFGTASNSVIADDDLLALLLEDGELLNLNELQEKQNIQLDTCRQAAVSMIDSSINSMLDFIQKHWLVHQSNLVFIGLLLNRVVHRIDRNAQSLQTVGDRFAVHEAKIAATLRSRGTASNSEDAALVTELANTHMQKNVHSLASMILLRIGKMISSFADSWQRELQQIQRHLKSVSLELANELNLPIDEHQSIQQAYFPLPGNWKRVRINVQQSLDQLINNLSQKLLYSICKTDPNQNSPSQQMLTEPTAEIRHLNELKLVELIDFSSRCLEENASKGERSLQSDSMANLASKLSAETIADTIRSTISSNFTDGCSRRLVLALPDVSGPIDQIDPLPRELADTISVLYSKVIDTPLLMMDGEQLHLDDLIHFLWPVSSGRNELIKRLFTRIDVDWPNCDR